MSDACPECAARLQRTPFGWASRRHAYLVAGALLLFLLIFYTLTTTSLLVSESDFEDLVEYNCSAICPGFCDDSTTSSSTDSTRV